MKSLDLNAIEMGDNWNKLVAIIDETFTGERHEKITKLHEHFKDRMIMAPASGTKYYHNAFPGGYVAHVLNVIDWGKKYYNLWKDGGLFTEDISEENIVFCCMFHDLGKIGNMSEDYYVVNTDDWQVKKYGRAFNHNPELHYMTVTDRAFHLLGKFHIDMSEKEFLGIKMADGLYEKGNENYFIEGFEWKTIKTNIGFIIHYADSTATRLEKEAYLFSGQSKIDYNKIMKGESLEPDAEVLEGLDVDKLGDLFK